MIKRFQFLHVQRFFWKPYCKNALCWVFYVIIDNTQVGGKVLQSDALHDMSQRVCPFQYKNQNY